MMRLSLLLVVCLAGLSNAWVSMTTPTPKKNNGINPLQKTRKNVASVGAAASISFAIALGGGAAMAGAVDFTGSYSDPFHPNCPRLIAMEGEKVIINGADGNPGCPTGNGKPWKLVGTAKKEEIIVDFSPKGGPKDLKGVWEAGKEPGIRWPDGNKWSLVGKPN